MSSRSFAPKTVAWVVAVAVGSFVLAIVLSAFADDLGVPHSAGRDSFSYSAIGHRGFVELVSRSGIEVVLRRTERPAKLGPQTPLVLAEPRVEWRPDEEAGSDRLLRLQEMAWSQGAQLVVVLPKWEGVPDINRPRWLSEVALMRLERVEAVVEALDPVLADDFAMVRRGEWAGVECETTWGDPVEIGLTLPQWIRPTDGVEPVVTCDGLLLVARMPGSELLIVSDPDVLNNHGLGEAENARMMHGLLAEELEASAIVVDETIHGFVRSSGLLAEMFRFPLVLATAHGALLLGVVVWSGAGRFGKPRSIAPPLDSGKRVLIENTAELVAVGGHTAGVLPRYYRQTLRAVAAHYFLPANVPEKELAVRLEEISASRGIRIDLDALRRSAESVTGTEAALKIAQRLHRWRTRMIDVH
jgi:hypothetical protein